MVLQNTVSVFPGNFVTEGKIIKDALEQALVFLRRLDVSLEVYLISQKEMHTLNRDYHAADCPTNILSFPAAPSFPAPESPGLFLGEIFLAPEYVRDHGEDIIFLAVHGLLHFLGYTHNDERDSIKMERKEREIIRHIHS